MFPYSLNTLEEFARHRSPHTLMPGDAEPEWLRRRAEHERVFAELKADARAARREAAAERRNRSILDRIRLALPRG
ncbi:MAG: hypothetical protein HYX53_14350 [Chloroflexi bacterium]|nr:hypothetical protein [Chloroflexota bacterium]